MAKKLGFQTCFAGGLRADLVYPPEACIVARVFILSAGIAQAYKEPDTVHESAIL